MADLAQTHTCPACRAIDRADGVEDGKLFRSVIPRVKDERRIIRALTDVPQAMREIRAGRLSPARYLWSLRGPIEFAVLAPDDPLPALLELPATAYLVWKRRATARAAEPLAVGAARPSGGGTA